MKSFLLCILLSSPMIVIADSDSKKMVAVEAGLVGTAVATSIVTHKVYGPAPYVPQGTVLYKRGRYNPYLTEKGPFSKEEIKKMLSDVKKGQTLLIDFKDARLILPIKYGTAAEIDQIAETVSAKTKQMMSAGAIKRYTDRYRPDKDNKLVYIFRYYRETSKGYATNTVLQEKSLRILGGVSFLTSVAAATGAAHNVVSGKLSSPKSSQRLNRNDSDRSISSEREYSGDESSNKSSKASNQ